MQIPPPPFLYTITLGPPTVAIGTAIAVILYLLGLGGVAKKQTWAPFLIALTTIGLMALFVFELSNDAGTSFNILVSGIVMAVVLVALSFIVYGGIKSTRYGTGNVKKL